MWTFKKIFTFGIVNLFYIYTQGEKCHNRTYIADVQEKLLYSPGYPQNYEVDYDCTWTISAASRASGYVVQLSTVEMDLIDYNSDCNTDYIAVYEGESTKGPFLAKWCGSDKQILKASRQVTLKFHSDGMFTGRGFVISYSLVRTAKSECVHGDPGRIYVGQSPVYETFLGSLFVPSCEWHIQSNDTNMKLVLELVKPSDISCSNGSYDFYDGGNTGSHVSYQYCSTKMPFSLMFLKSNNAVVAFRNIANTEPDGLILKISARDPLYECTVSEMPTVEVRDGPVMLALPLATNSRKTPCPVRLWNPDTNTHLRLDVMATDDKEADCDTDVITVSEMSTSKSLQKSCNRRQNPVYRQSASDSLVVTSSANVYVRVANVDSDCDGRIIRRTAEVSKIQEQTIPFKGKYLNLDYCKYLISGEHDNEIVHLHLLWTAASGRNHPSNLTVCEGDYVNIYDGDRETSPILFSSCWSSDGSIDRTVVSSQRHLLVVLDADAKIEGKSFNIRFHAIPGDHRCTEQTKINVTRQSTLILSPNYPGIFSMDQLCTYILEAENPEDHIVVQVDLANLDERCKSYLAVYKGASGGAAVGRVCGNDTPTFRISGSKGRLVAVSGESASDSVWRVYVYTEEMGRHSAGNSVTFCLIVIGLNLALQLFI